MKLKTLFITCIACSGLFLSTSCIKEEGLDREADILSISIDDKNFLTSIINEETREISMIVVGDISHYKSGTITPTIDITEGATVVPESGTPVSLIDFQHFYKVTAEDGGAKSYAVKVNPYEPLVQDFEKWRVVNTNPKRPYDMPVDDMWTNANPGVIMLYRDNVLFPTRRSTDVHPESGGEYSVVLETVDGNKSDVNIMNIPIYAGNMFRGEFDKLEAMKDPLSTTKFGQPHPKYLGKALRLEAQYKYKSGSIFTTWEYVNGRKKIEEIPGQLDKPDIYAVLYKVPKGSKGRNVFLTAKNIKTSSAIVATAFMADTSEKEDWTKLETEFKYSEELNFEKNDYKLAIVLSSSEGGANYRGAKGSILTVDDLKVICESDLKEKE